MAYKQHRRDATQHFLMFQLLLVMFGCTAANVTTEAFALGVDCTNKTDQDHWCNNTISGKAECGTDGRCHCEPSYFEFNTTMCIPKTGLVPISLKTYGITTSSFNISWSMKDSVKVLPLSYTVKVEGGSIESYCIKHPRNTMANCSGLAPGFQYNVHVTGTVVFVNESSSGFNVIQERTFPDIPGSLDRTSSNFATPHVTLVWTRSFGRVDFYTLVVTQSDTSVVIKNHSTVNEQAQIAIEGLTGGTHYNVLITANSYGRASQGKEDTFRTLTEVPGPPKYPTVVMYTNDTITIKWKVTNQPNGEIQGHKVCVMYRRYDDEIYEIMECENTTDATYTSYTRSGLSAGTFFKFDVYTINDMFIGSSISIEQRTQESVPGKVSGLKATPNGGTLIKLTWKRPSQPNGDIILYQIYWTRLTDQQNCSNYLKTPVSSALPVATCYNNISDQSSITVNQVYMEYTITHLMPHTEYKIQVRAFTSAGSGDVDSKTTQTRISKPREISGFTYTLYNQTDSCDATKVLINWEEPALLDRNSLITQYRFHVQGSLYYIYNVSNPDPYSVMNRKFAQSIISMDPEKSHEWAIYAVSEDSKTGQRTTFTVIQGVCAPPDWAKAELELVEAINSTTSSVTLVLPSAFFQKTQQGSIQEKGLIILPGESQFFDDTKAITLGELITWKTAHEHDFVKEYKIIILRIVDGEYTIGKDDECSTSTIQDNFCNGPLPEKFFFKVAAYVCTRRTGTLLCTISSSFGPFATKKNEVSVCDGKVDGNNVTIIAVAVGLGVIIVALATCTTYLVLKLRRFQTDKDVMNRNIRSPSTLREHPIYVNEAFTANIQRKQKLHKSGGNGDTETQYASLDENSRQDDRSTYSALETK